MNHKGTVELETERLVLRKFKLEVKNKRIKQTI